MNHALPHLEQPTHGGFFTNASGINITDSVLTDIRGDFHLHAEKTGNGLLPYFFLIFD
jgi:hypothetical protein